MSPEGNSPETPSQPPSGQGNPQGSPPPQGYPPPSGAQQGQSPPQGYPPPQNYPPPQGYPPPGGGQGGPSQGPGGPRKPEKQDEKQNEKETEKQQEKGRGMDEKYRRNPLGVLSFALIVIWLGVMLLLMNTDRLEDREGWAIFAWGGAVIIFLEAFIRLAVPRWRRSVTGSFIWGAVWAGVGFGLWYEKWEVIGPLVVIAIGVGLLVSRLVPRR